MSRHEGVSCDSCLKSNFRGRRYKCLICYDYDLCASCYEEGAISTRHSADHPMQCILTRSDFELYYGGEILSQEQPQSFTCPYCKKMGLSDSALLDHVGAEHTDTGLEVVCPVCAALPGGDPNLVTDDFAGHLTLEHRTGPRDLISFLDEPSAIRHGGVRRIPHSGRALGGPRSRRSNMHFSSSGGLSALSPSGRDSVDPIAELLSQLSGVRRGAPQPSQLQQLQMQLEFERQQVSATRQQLLRLPRRQPHPVVTSSNSANNGSGSGGNGSGSSSQQQQTGLIGSSSINSRDPVPVMSSSPLPLGGGSATTGNPSSGSTAQSSHSNQSQFLLARFMTPTLDEAEQNQLDRDRADRSQFVQSLMLSTLTNLELLKTAEEDEDEEEDAAKTPTQNSSDDNVVGDDAGNEGSGGGNNYENLNNDLENQKNQQLGIPRSGCGGGGGGGVGGGVGGGGGGGGGGCIQKSTKPKPPAHSSKPLLTSSGGLVGSQQDRRTRPPPPPAQSKPPRDLKTNSMSSTKHVPDTR